MYIHFNGNPCSLSIGDCVIRAISIVTGYSRHKVYAGLCLQGYPCTIWGNSNAVWADYLLYLGFRRYTVYGKQTVEEFSKVHPHGRYIIGDALQNITMQNMGNTNALVSAIRDGIQSIKDDLCADRLEAERRENSNLRTQLSMAQLAASQTAQTAQLEANNAFQTQYIVNRVAPYPIPAYTVANPVTPATGA